MGSEAKSPSALARFSHDWIGGGIPAVRGSLAGTGDSAVETGQDFVHIGESIWHGITSIF